MDMEMMNQETVMNQEITMMNQEMDMMKEETQQNSDEQKSSSSSSPLKSCTECYAVKTPLWRSGPHGPKSLCNACGIKYNKKRREALGLDKPKRSSEVTEILEMLQCMPAGDEAMEQKSQYLMSKLGEEERAAILLMNLSCGDVYA